MANTTVGAQVNVEFASVGQMRKAIKEATSDLITMQEQFGKTSPQAIAAAKRIAELKDRIQDAKEQADLFDPGKRFSAFANAANQIAAGFSAVQGAMALVGTESEDLQKTLVKVQGAIALSQGLSQLKDLGKAYDEIKIVAVNAFRAIKTAIGSTGIGLLVVALGAIVAYWDDIKAAVSGVSSEQKKLNADADKNLKTQQDKLSAINSQENILKLQGKSEKEILQIKVKQTDETIKASEVQLQNNIATTKAQVEASKRNKEILQGILEFITAPLGLLLKGVDAVGKALGKNFDIYDKFYGSISSFVFDPKQVEEEGNKTIKEQEKALTELKNQRAGFQLQLNEIDKKAAEDRKAANEKLAKDRKPANEKLAKDKPDEAKMLAEKQAAADKVLDDARRAKLTEQQREEEDAIRAFEERKKTLAAAGITDLTSITEQQELELAAIRKKYADEDEAKRKEAEQKKIEAEKKESERLAEALENTRKMVAEQNAALLQAEIELQNQRFNAAQAGLQLLEGLAGENERIANLIFAVQKGLEIARIITDTARGIVAAKAGLAAVPPFIGVVPNPAFVLAAAAAAKQIVGLKIAAGVSIAQIAGASIQRFKRGGSAGAAGGGGGADVAGGGAAPVAAQPSPSVTATAVNTQAVNNLGNQAMRAYVLNSDITNNDQKNAYLQRNARLG